MKCHSMLQEAVLSSYQMEPGDGNSGCHTWHQAPLPAEPSRWLTHHTFLHMSSDRGSLPLKQPLVLLSSLTGVQRVFLSELPEPVCVLGSWPPPLPPQSFSERTELLRLLLLESVAHLPPRSPVHPPSPSPPSSSILDPSRCSIQKGNHWMGLREMPSVRKLLCSFRR